jgi:threonine aldolase
MFGGGMRQAGIIAAGALHALEHHRSRLAADHANARALAEGLARLPGIELDPVSVQTNIVLMRVVKLPAANLARTLGEAGVRVLATSPNTSRAGTSLMVSSEDISMALAGFKKILGREH